MKTHIYTPITIVSFFLLFALLTEGAFAQKFNIYDVDTSQYPLVKALIMAKQMNKQDYLNLKKDEFTVFENGVDMKATLDIDCTPSNVVPPISVAILLDVSSSMNDKINGETKFSLAKFGAKAFIDSIILNPPSAVEIIAFGNQTYVNNFTGFQTTKPPLYTILDNMVPANGGTNYNPPFQYANGAIATLKTRPDYVRRVIIFLTDGDPDQNFPFKYDEIGKACVDAKIQLYSITIGDFPNSGLDIVTQYTGGYSFDCYTKEELTSIYQKIAHDIQFGNLCRLTWVSPWTCSETGRQRDVKAIFKRIPDSSNTNYMAPLGKSPAMSATQLLFGAPGIGTTTRQVTISANEADIKITGVTFNPDNKNFQVDWKGKTLPFTLKKGENLTVDVKYVESPPTAPHETIMSVTSEPCPAKDISLIAPCGSDVTAKIDFKDVPIMTSKDSTVTCIFKNTTLIEVTGNAQLAGADKGEFQVVSGSGPFKLGPNGCLSMTLKFKPTSAGVKNAEIDFNVDICGLQKTLLTGKGITTDFTMPEIDFDKKRVKTVNKMDYVITNITPAKIKITSIKVRTSPDANFIFTLPTAPIDLDKGADLKIPVTFTPQTEFSHENYIEITIENFPNTYSGKISGFGFLPKIQNVKTIAFPNTKVNTKSAAKDLVITNPSQSSDMLIKSLTIPNGSKFKFETPNLTNITVTMNNGSQTFPITYNPTAEATDNSYVIISSDAAEGPNTDPTKLDTVYLTGTSLSFACTPEDINFGNVLTCNSIDTNVIVISNLSNDIMSIDSVVLSGTGKAAYTFNLSKKSVDPKGTANISVKFAPQDVLTYDAKISVYTSLGNDNVILKGAGTILNSAAKLGTYEDEQAPNKQFDLNFTIDIPSLKEQKISTITYYLNYNTKLLSCKLVDKPFTSTSIPGWTWTPTEKDNQLVIEGSGSPVATPLKVQNTVTMKTYLGDTPSTSIVLMHELEKGALKCVTAIADTAPTGLKIKTCFTQGRLIQVNSSQLGLADIEPNPATGEVNISYSLGLNAPAKLEIYNSMGELVKTVFDTFKNSGDYSVTVPINDLSSGVYIYTLQSGQFKVAKRLIITN